MNDRQESGMLWVAIAELDAIGRILVIPLPIVPDNPTLSVKNLNVKNSAALEVFR
jgi:hypothetical protein